jgi:hypothetical protein
VAIPLELRQVAERVAPVTLAQERTLPLHRALQPLLPDGVLARGSVVGVQGVGATSLALGLAAEASRAGSWTVVVGLPAIGLAAAAELGVDLGRLALVAAPPDDPSAWAPALAALVGAVDLVVLDGRAPLRAGEVRRLAARARERGSVLVPTLATGLASAGGGSRAGGSGARGHPGRGRCDHPIGEWTTDVTLTAADARWEGLGDGHGHLRRRRLTVTAEGRGRASRPREGELWLPAPGGGLAWAGAGVEGGGDRDARRRFRVLDGTEDRRPSVRPADVGLGDEGRQGQELVS